jgi:hypothetical protein
MNDIDKVDKLAEDILVHAAWAAFWLVVALIGVLMLLLVRT